MSKHGGSSPSGLVLPIGLEALRPEVPDGMVLVPQEVIDARKQAAERQARALQLERRRIALELIPSIYSVGPLGSVGAEFISNPSPQVVTDALTLTDELIKQTGGGI